MTTPSLEVQESRDSPGAHMWIHRWEGISQQRLHWYRQQPYTQPWMTSSPCWTMPPTKTSQLTNLRRWDQKMTVRYLQVKYKIHEYPRSITLRIKYIYKKNLHVKLNYNRLVDVLQIKYKHQIYTSSTKRCKSSVTQSHVILTRD